MYYLEDPKRLPGRSEKAMYYEVVKYPAVGIATCKHPVTRSALIKRGFTDITDRVGKAGGLDGFLRRVAGLADPKPAPKLEPPVIAPAPESEPEKNPEGPETDPIPEPEPEPAPAPAGSTPEPEPQPGPAPEKTALTYDEIKRMTKPELVTLAKIHGLDVGIDLPRFALISEIWKAVKPCE